MNIFVGISFHVNSKKGEQDSSAPTEVAAASVLGVGQKHGYAGYSPCLQKYERYLVLITEIYPASGRSIMTSLMNT